jgi:hypothetical protein
MSEVVALKTQTALEPIDAGGLAALAAKGKSNPQSVVTLKAKTVCESKFRNLTYVRNLEAHVITTPHLLGDDTARTRPKPSSPRSAPACRSACTPTRWRAASPSPGSNSN